MKKKLIFIIFVLLTFQIVYNCYLGEVYAQTIVIEYKLYTESGEYLTILPTPKVGEFYISSDNRLFQIVSIGFDTAVARFIEVVQMPEVRDVTDKDLVLAALVYTTKNYGVYHTHNAESYVHTDGYDSIYGKGGIHDVGKSFVNDLKSFNSNVEYDETLHLPHDTYAYSRSAVTANKLLQKNEMGALIDVHRDGIARSEYYSVDINGAPGSKIRLVVGMANAKKSDNLDFALALKAYADANYPGLIKDIFLASGSYNQEKFERAILLEMGTYLIEKPLILRTATFMADVFDGVLYTRSVLAPDGENSYAEEIGTIETLPSEQSVLELPYFKKETTKNETQNAIIAITICAIISAVLVGSLFYNRKKM